MRRKILLHLYRHGCWNEKHTAFEKTYQGVPGHLKGTAKQEAFLMIKENLIVAKPTSYGLQVSMNVDKMKEIEEFLSGLI